MVLREDFEFVKGSLLCPTPLPIVDIAISTLIAKETHFNSISLMFAISKPRNLTLLSLT